MATAMQQDVSEKQIRPVEPSEPAAPSKRRIILPIVGVLVLIASDANNELEDDDARTPADGTLAAL